MSYENHLCYVCKQPVNLRTTNTDENGQAVHGECYIRKLGDDAARKSPSCEVGGAATGEWKRAG
jgi:hypothetical protein